MRVLSYLGRSAAACLITAAVLFSGAFVDSVVGPGRYSASTGDFLNSLGVKMQARAANNAEMAAYKWGGRIIRDGFAAAGDGGQATYTHSASACAISGGDGGTQISSGAGGCFTIDWASVNQTANPLLFEAPSSTDDTVAIRKAVATGKTVDLCAKTTWAVTGDITRSTTGQVIKGCGKGRTYVLANGASGFTLGVMVNASGIQTVDRDYTIFTAQPDTNVKANLVTYPPLFYLRNCPRFRIESVGTFRATVGIDMKGNSGGAVIRDWESSAFNIGLDIDGSLDTVRVEDMHWYPFFLTANQQQIFFGQGTDRPIGINSGRMDDLKISGGLFIGGLGMNFYNGDGTVSGSGGAGPTFAQLSNTNFDTFSGIAASGQSGIICAGCLFTTGNSAAQAINLSGGAQLLMSGSRVYVGAGITKSPVVVGGDGTFGAAYLNWTGGSLELGIPNDIPLVAIGTVGGAQFGQVSISGVAFKEPTHASARTNPVILGGSSARLNAIGNSISDFGSGGGTFISLATDSFHRVIGNVGPGWAYKVGGATMPDQLAVTAGGGRYLGN